MANYKGYPDPSRVISVREAADLPGREGALFVDTRNYWKYVEGHVPGAVNLELYAFHWIDTSPEGMKAFIRQMIMLFESYGIDERKQVIFYEENSGYDAARGVWLVELLGGRGRLLDGGLGLWVKEGLPISTEDPKIERAHFNARLDESLVLTLAEMRRAVSARSIQVIDCRSRGEYDGSYRRALRAGHVPGSENVEWKRALADDGTLKSAGELAGLYPTLKRGDEVATYCQSGYRAAHSWLVLRLLGFDRVRNYIGSWYEWGNSSETEVVNQSEKG